MENDVKKAKKKIFVFLIGLLVIGTIWFLYWLFYGRINIKTADSYVNGNQTIVTSQVSGTIKEVLVEESQSVKEGELLAVVDDTDAQMDLKIAEFKLGIAIKKYFSLKDQMKIAQDLIEESKNNLIKATEDYNRDLKSYKFGLVSKEKLQHVENIYKNSTVNLRKNRQKLKNIKTEAYSKDILTHPIVAEAIENYKKAYLNLARTKIYSPISGVTTKKNIFVGQQIYPGENIITVIDLNNIWVDANYKETEMSEFRIGNIVELESDYNGKKYKGYISGISPGSGSALSLLPAQNASGNWIKVVQRVPVRIAILHESLQKNGTIPIGTSISSTVKIRETYDKKEEFAFKKSDLYPLDENIIKIKIREIIRNNIDEE